MRIFKKAFDTKEYLLQNKKMGVSIGFVPTMGALHQGHISLLETAKKNCSLVVCSIFVNPTQFNDKADFDNYPVTIESDIDKLERAGCDVLFLPTVTEMYPQGETVNGKYNLGYLETVLEGKYRPGHFQGVCQVVHRLLNIIPANNLYLGQKDYQQCMVIKKMMQLTKINTNVIICPTLREDDGLAMSSRNMRLNETERKKSAAIFEALSFIKKNIVPGDINPLKKQVFLRLAENGFKPDYVEIASADNLSIIDEWDGKIKLVALIAAFNGKVRLIDNLLLQ
ncbi:MAG: pantoate--beta-alanine ligase [Ferruginibacter sp.]|nr:pantoate--beta-alanine ligase [Ferruginibacter sp.]